VRFSIRPFSRLLLVLCVLVQSGLGLAGSNSVRAQEETIDAPPQVNLEIILDSSGSMANLTDTGETRMDAAKRVLAEVINSIPQRPGQINVGFRLYGHRGDNTDATKDVSCKASDLLVPVSGVDQPALIGAVNSAQPTGWTPISRSLSRAGKDFPEAGADVANTVLLVTDGVETCDGDPVKVAGDLHKKASVQMTTHVVGFGTTPDEQNVLQGIADAGGGKLFGASNAQQLRSALFDVLTQLKIVVGVGYVGGNAFGVLPQGDPGKISVVASAYQDLTSTLSFTLRNNTGSDVAGLKVTVTIRDSAGNLVAAGDATQVSPFFVRAGGIGFGGIWLGTNTVIPDDAQYEWKITEPDRDDLQYENNSDLSIVEASLFENRIAGTVRNDFDEEVAAPFFFTGACYNEDGSMVGTVLGTLDIPSLAPGEEQTFQVELSTITYSDEACPAFFVAGDGRGPIQIPEIAPDTGQTSVATATEEAAQEDESRAGDFHLEGVTAAALRNFDAGESVLTGLLSVGTAVFVFDSEEAATSALDQVLQQSFDVKQMDRSTANEVSAPKVGDDRIALTYTFTNSGFSFPIAVMVIRDGVNVYYFQALCRDANPMEALAEIVEAVFSPDREPGDGEGAFALLPTLDEVPYGLSIELEKVPADWGPIPSA